MSEFLSNIELRKEANLQIGTGSSSQIQVDYDGSNGNIRLNNNLLLQLTDSAININTQLNLTEALKLGAAASGNEVAGLIQWDGANLQVYDTEWKTVAFETDVNLLSISEDTHFVTGFVAPDDTTISFDTTTKIFTITPTGANFSVYINGVKYIKTTEQVDLTSIWSDRTLFFVYYNSSGVLSAMNTVWEIVSGNAPVATIFWNGVGGVPEILGDERHKATRNLAWHKWAHNTIGTKYRDGFDTSFTDSTMSITNGRLEDEDIVLDHDAGPYTTCYVFYRYTGGAAITYANAPSNVPVALNAGVPQFDDAGTLTDLNDGYYVRNYIYGTNDMNKPIACIVGQAQYSNINDARNDEFPVQPTYISSETRLLYAIIWKNNGGSAEYIEHSDFRTAPTKPNGALSERPIFLDEIEDIIAPNPSLDQVLRWNGSNWVNGEPALAGGTGAVSYYNAAPVIDAVSAENDTMVATLSATPVTSAEQVVAKALATNTLPISAWVSAAALGRVTLQAGKWVFNTYAGVNSTGGGRVTTLSRAIYSVLPCDGKETVTITGTGTSRTVTALDGTPFAVTKIDASGTNTDASWLQTPKGLYQITARTSDTVVTITTPSGYVNESTVAFSVWKKLFISGQSSPVTSITPTYNLYTWSSTQSAFTITTLHKLGAITFGTSNNTTTITTVYNGTLHNSYMLTPLTTLHNDLGGIQGGTAGEYYHFSLTDYTNLRSGGNSTLHYHASDRALANATGQLAVSLGGTNIKSYNAGDILYATASTTLSKLTIGSPTNVLKVNVGGTAPEWSTISVSDLTDEDDLLSNCLVTTYAELVASRDASKLIVGQNYLISDFAQSYNIFDGGTMNIIGEQIGTAEPIIVTASKVNELYKVAISTVYPQDIIHYSLDILDIRDIGFGNGADTVNANFKGQIYYRKDTIQNVECHYDFRNVKFRRWAVGAVTFNNGTAYVAKDVCKSTVDGKIYKCITATTGEGDPTVNTADWVLWLDITADAFVSWTANKTQFNIGDINTDKLIINNVLIGVDYDYFYTFGNYYNWVKNVSIGMIDLEFVIGDGAYITQLNNTVFKTIDDYYTCFSNEISSNNWNNTIGNNFYSNTIGNSFNSNTIGYDFYSNAIGNNFYSNTIGISFRTNTIGNNFYSNTIGNNFYSNAIGNNFYSNTIGINFNYNTIGNYFYSNVIGNSFNYSTIGNSFNYNRIGHNFVKNIIGNNLYKTIFGNTCQYNTICNSINGTATNKIITFGNNITMCTIQDFAFGVLAADLNLSVATVTTHIRGAYNTTIYQDKTDGVKLSYMDGGVMQIVDVTA